MKDLSGGGTVSSYRTQDTATHRHDERGRHPFAADVGDSDPKTVFTNRNVIVIIPTHLAGWDIDPSDFISGNVRGSGGKQNTLNIASRVQIAIDTAFFGRFRVHNCITKSKRGLLDDRLENDKIGRGKRRAHRAVGDC